jgi:acetyl esterase
MSSVTPQNCSQPLHELFRSEAISAETQVVNDRLVATLASLNPPSDLPGMRDAYSRGLLGVPVSPKSPRARRATIPGPAGPLDLRILVPDDVRGVYLHFHGGGWIVGSNDTWDEQLELFGREAGMATVSVNYRLAPEHVFPAAVDDCVATAIWLIDHAQAEFGTSWLAIGGESAGSNLAVSTLVRLRDMGHVEPFRAANLLFGCYDLSLTPSVRSATDEPFVNRAGMEQFTTAFGGGIDLRDPEISPLYADLHGLPPALFTVGSVDPLRDDSLFMHMRWQAAGNLSELAIFPGGTHGFNSMDGELARTANYQMAQFLGARRLTQ